MTCARDPFIFTLALKPVPQAVKEARDLIAFAWAHWGLDDDYTARLIMSELATNALRASAENQYVVVRCYLREDGTPILEVWDESCEPLVMRETAVDDEGGRGLFLVDLHAKDWGVHPTAEGGKLIRVELRAEGAGPVGV